jgi:hypothetical protein
MTIQFGTTLRNARCDQIETSVGTSPILQLRSGAQPANCAAADSGTLLAAMTLPSDWIGAASGGVKTLLGVWQDTSADAAGTVAHFRMKDSGGTVTHIQGSVTSVLVGTGDMLMDNPVLAAGQLVTGVTFTLTEGNP